MRKLISKRLRFALPLAVAAGLGLVVSHLQLRADKVRLDNHDCTSVTCLDLQTRIDDGNIPTSCGWCTGIDSPYWDKCTPEGNTSPCYEDNDVNGIFHCKGTCTKNPWRACEHDYGACSPVPPQ